MDVGSSSDGTALAMPMSSLFPCKYCHYRRIGNDLLDSFVHGSVVSKPISGRMRLRIPPSVNIDERETTRGSTEPDNHDGNQVPMRNKYQHFTFACPHMLF